MKRELSRAESHNLRRTIVCYHVCTQYIKMPACWLAKWLNDGSVNTLPRAVSRRKDNVTAPTHARVCLLSRTDSVFARPRWQLLGDGSSHTEFSASPGRWPQINGTGWDAQGQYLLKIALMPDPYPVASPPSEAALIHRRSQPGAASG